MIMVCMTVTSRFMYPHVMIPAATRCNAVAAADLPADDIFLPGFEESERYEIKSYPKSPKLAHASRRGVTYDITISHK